MDLTVVEFSFMPICETLDVILILRQLQKKYLAKKGIFFHVCRLR